MEVTSPALLHLTLKGVRHPAVAVAVAVAVGSYSGRSHLGSVLREPKAMGASEGLRRSWVPSTEGGKGPTQGGRWERPKSASSGLMILRRALAPGCGRVPVWGWDAQHPSSSQPLEPHSTQALSHVPTALSLPQGDGLGQ